MKYAVFFRNVNLGRPNCPMKAQLEEAFMNAGADSASSFLTNGTLVFAVTSTARARDVFDSAGNALRTTCGLKEPAFIRTVDYLAALVDLDPFASVDRGSVYECCVSFLHSQHITPPKAPLTSKRGDVEILRVTPAEVLSVSRKIGNTAGSPNAFLEKLLGSPFTTRSWNTIARLVQKHA